jgi:cytochrome bd-type quinol oxidase subunit 2
MVAPSYRTDNPSTEPFVVWLIVMASVTLLSLVVMCPIQTNEEKERNRSCAKRTIRLTQLAGIGWTIYGLVLYVNDAGAIQSTSPDLYNLFQGVLFYWVALAAIPVCACICIPCILCYMDKDKHEKQERTVDIEMLGVLITTLEQLSTTMKATQSTEAKPNDMTIVEII